MNRSNVRDYVRDFLDVDSEDISDSILNTWISEGEKRAIRFERRWPFYETVATFDTVAGTGSYALGAALPDMEEITFITAPDREVRFTSHREAERTYTDTSSSTAATPSFYSLFGGELHLWPKPASVVTLTVRGYRNPTFVDGDVADFDWPEEFDDVLKAWVLHRALFHQDYGDLASYQKALFEESLRGLHSRLVMTPAAEPLILNGGSAATRRFQRDPLRPGRYPWQ